MLASGELSAKGAQLSDDICLGWYEYKVSQKSSLPQRSVGKATFRRPTTQFVHCNSSSKATFHPPTDSGRGRASVPVPASESLVSRSVGSENETSGNPPLDEEYDWWVLERTHEQKSH